MGMMSSEVVYKKSPPPKVEEQKPQAAPFPTVEDDEKKEYLNGFYRRTYTNVKKRTLGQRIRENFTPMNKFLFVFVPLLFFTTFYTLMFHAFKSEELQKDSITLIQTHLLNHVITFFDTILYAFKEYNGEDITQVQNMIHTWLTPSTLTSTFVLTCIVVLFLYVQLLSTAKFLYQLTKRLLFGPQRAPVYILDFATMKTDQALRITYPLFDNKSRAVKSFTEDSMSFQNKILSRSCISEHSTFPPGIHQKVPQITMQAARDESIYIFKQIVGDVLKITNTKPKDIDLLIVNCSLFCPTPSLSAMIINLFGMREDIKNYNLGGMGCSAGLVSIDLARDLLNTYPNSNCLVVSTENITQNWYHGNDRSSLMSNTLFRMGGAAILLTNKPKYVSTAKYELVTTTRVMRASDQESYDAVYQLQDEEMKTGVRLSVNLIKCATKAVTKNLTRMLMNNPTLLPFGEIVKFVFDAVKRKMYKNATPYIPDFGKIFDHLCIHAGGKKGVG
ncbi:3-ketoacyl-CoA synthase [Acrasis kona]|uniref:3-ketoacyl-CoA synthase n=1 Tax=Acrasis kona TaxID=1008807 RepID=A0AAW2YXA6_9EUKA